MIHTILLLILEVIRQESNIQETKFGIFFSFLTDLNILPWDIYSITPLSIIWRKKFRIFFYDFQWCRLDISCRSSKVLVITLIYETNRMSLNKENNKFRKSWVILSQLFSNKLCIIWRVGMILKVVLSKWFDISRE